LRRPAPGVAATPPCDASHPEQTDRPVSVVGPKAADPPDQTAKPLEGALMSPGQTPPPPPLIRGLLRWPGVPVKGGTCVREVLRSGTQWVRDFGTAKPLTSELSDYRASGLPDSARPASREPRNRVGSSCASGWTTEPRTAGPWKVGLSEVTDSQTPRPRHIETVRLLPIAPRRTPGVRPLGGDRTPDSVSLVPQDCPVSDPPDYRTPGLRLSESQRVPKLRSPVPLARRDC